MTKTDDKSRKWMWWFLAAVVAAQLYFVRELLAAFALFAAGFAVVAVLVSGIYMMQKVWEVGVARMAERSGKRATSYRERPSLRRTRTMARSCSRSSALPRERRC